MSLLLLLFELTANGENSSLLITNHQIIGEKLTFCKIVFE